MPTFWPMPLGEPNGGSPWTVRRVLQPLSGAGVELDAELDQDGISGRSHQRAQLGGIAEVDRLPAVVRLGFRRAVPVRVRTARSPAVPAVLTDGDLGVGGLVGPGHGAVLPPDGQLP